jgi:hypothetical protein
MITAPVRSELAVVGLSLMEPPMSPVSGPGIQLNPATTRPSLAKKSTLCDARKVSIPVT